MIYIYTLTDPTDLRIRYVGRTKSIKVRLKGHISKSSKRKTHKDCWIYSLKKKGYTPIIEIIDTLDCSWTDSHKIEREYIKSYLKSGHNLVNHDDRGEGGVNKKISKKQREQISKTVTKRHMEGALSCGRKPVDLYNLEAEFIKSFKSMKDCAMYIGVSEKHLQAYFKRKDKRLKGYIPVRDGTKPSPWQYKKRDNKTKIKVVYKGVTYNSLKEASVASGYAANTISTHINGKIKNQKFFKAK